MSRFLPPDPTKGDETTIGGYAAVHARPAALEGRDGMSYSVGILAEPDDARAGAFGAYFLFLQWKRMGEQGIAGHLESGFLAWGATKPDAVAALGAMAIPDVQRVLDELIRERA